MDLLQTATTFSILEETIWDVRLRRLEDKVLGDPHGWKNFTIWNAGKQGRRLYRSLSTNIQQKVSLIWIFLLQKIYFVPYGKYCTYWVIHSFDGKLILVKVLVRFCVTFHFGGLGLLWCGWEEDCQRRIYIWRVNTPA